MKNNYQRSGCELIAYWFLKEIRFLNKSQWIKYHPGIPCRMQSHGFTHTHTHYCLDYVVDFATKDKMMVKNIENVRLNLVVQSIQVFLFWVVFCGITIFGECWLVLLSIWHKIDIIWVWNFNVCKSKTNQSLTATQHLSARPVSFHSQDMLSTI